MNDLLLKFGFETIYDIFVADHDENVLELRKTAWI